MAMADAWSEVRKTYFVDDETVTATEIMTQNGYKNFADVPSLQFARVQVEESVKKSVPIQYDVTTRLVTIPGSDQQPPVPVYVHTPKQLDRPAQAIVLYFHGGGLILASTRATSPICDSIVCKSGAIFVDVEYRLVPNKDDPMCPFNDAVAAASWVMDNKEQLGAAPDCHVGVAGDSSGGQIACCVSREVSGIDFQVLIYPVLDIDCSVDSMKRFYSVPMFGGRDMERMFEYCLPGVEDPVNNPRFNPSANPRLDAMPSTFILNAALDPIVDWAIAYESKLKKAGVTAKSSLYKGLPHIFFTVPSLFPKACEKAHLEVADFIKSFM